MGDRGEAVASTLTDIGPLESRLANADSLARGAKVTLSVIVGADNLRQELGTFCYILTGLFGYACPYVSELKGIVEWAASNRYAFERAISNSHQATALIDDVSRLLSEYLNDCVQASYTGNLTQPKSLTPVSILHLSSKLKFLPYHGIARLHPTLRALVRDHDIYRVAAGLPTTGNLNNKNDNDNSNKSKIIKYDNEIKTFIILNIVIFTMIIIFLITISINKFIFVIIIIIIILFIIIIIFIFIFISIILIILYGNSKIKITIIIIFIIIFTIIFRLIIMIIIIFIIIIIIIFTIIFTIILIIIFHQI